MNDTQQGSRSRHEIWLEPLLVWALLIAILAASAWSAFLPLGAFNSTVNLFLAALMLLVLAMFLMDLRNAKSVLRLVAAAGLFWVIFLFALTFTDYLTRRPTAGTEPPVHSRTLANGFHSG